MSTDPGSVKPVLSLREISKRFGPVQAVRGVSVDCRAGEIHAVVGENGSGKSTLLGVASGVLVPDEGVVEINGQQLHHGSTRNAIRLGLGMAYQTYSEILDLSIAENLYLAVPPADRPSYSDMDSWAMERLREFDLALDVRSLVGSVSLAQRQMLEVVKALLPDPAVLLLDEPTTALGPGEVEHLHELVLERAARGVGVVYVSHRLPEILGIANRVTVLRDGISQGTFDVEGMSEDDLVALMIGRPLELAFPDREGESGPDAVLTISRLYGQRFGPIDLTVRKGEILGVAGAEGNGQVQFLRSVAGVERSAGKVYCNGAPVDLRSPAGALRSGIVLLSGERARESLFAVLGVRANSSIQVLKRFSQLGLVRRRHERYAVSEIARQLKVRAASTEQPVQFLSGGNQQKIVLTRPFLRESLTAILADEPTQGVDVRSRFDIYEALRQKAKEGVAVIIKSSDPIELSGFCDRVIVLSRGRIKDEIPGDELSEQRIIEAIVGSRAITGRDGEAVER